ncbi:MAG TPA: response regulator [Acidobacteriaceae bacterium]
MNAKPVFETVLIAELKKRGIFANPKMPRPIVLVVDDEELITDTIVRILEQHDIAGMAAYNAEGALATARLVAPDLLLSDVMMPGMSGINLAIAVREFLPDCKVVLFSGQAATMDLLADARQAGHDFVTLVKPVHPTDLLAQIKESLKCAVAPLRLARPAIV